MLSHLSGKELILLIMGVLFVVSIALWLFAFGGWKLFRRNKIFRNLESEHRKAAIRLWLEVIEADGMTSTSEVNYLPPISPAQFNNARKLSFADAIEIVKGLDEKTRKMVLDTTEGLIGADGDKDTKEMQVLDAVRQAIPHC